MEAIEYAKTKPLASDVLGAILAFAYRDHDVEQFLDRGNELQVILSEIEAEGEYPILTEFFRFSKTGPEPYSRRLDEALSRLQLGGLVGRKNPSYELVEISENIESFLDNVAKEILNEDQLEEIKAVSTLFAERHIPGKVRYA